MKRTRVLIVDSHTLIRSGVRALLTNIPEVEVVSEASDGAEALRLMQQHQPELVFLDIAMPKLDGLELTARITKEFPEVRVIILSSSATSDHARQALRAGAAGLLLKSTTREEFETAVKSVAKGGTYVSQQLSNDLMEDVRRQGGESLSGSLTPRQREILKLIAEGQSTKQIAMSLSISAKTVETHRAQLMDRLDIHDIAGLVRYAIENDIIQLEE